MKLYYILSLSLTLVLFACSKDEPVAVPLSGTIHNEAFEVGQSTYTEEEGERLQFYIFSDVELSDNPCSIFPQGIQIFFRADNTMEKQDLFLDFSSFEAFTVSIFFSNAQEDIDIIITEGSFQIIENNNGMITADLVLRSDDGTELDGRFIAELCE